jgi:hypothetical protein
MPQCQFPIFCCFCVSEKLYRKYSQNWTKQKLNLLFLPTWDEVRSWDGGGPGASHTIGWRGPAPGHATRWWGHLAHLLMLPLHLYILLDEKNPRGRSLFPETYHEPPPSSTQDREGPEALPGTLSKRGITTGGLLHHHACLWSDVWVVYLWLWVHSTS